jgi:hypothetical protein
VLGILADLLCANRTLIEDLLARVKKLELSKEPANTDLVTRERHAG